MSKVILKKGATFAPAALGTPGVTTGEIWEDVLSEGNDRYSILINGSAPRQGSYLFADLATAEMKLKFELRMVDAVVDSD